MNQILLRGFHQIFDEFQMLIAKMSTALKITEIVSFKIASEASYVYFWLDKKTEACGLTVFKIEQKFKCDISNNFQTLCVTLFFILYGVRVLWRMLRYAANDVVGSPGPVFSWCSI